ncbi:hypothetical protein [Streptomyces sp. NPDC048611]
MFRAPGAACGRAGRRVVVRPYAGSRPGLTGEVGNGAVVGR